MKTSLHPIARRRFFCAAGALGFPGVITSRKSLAASVAGQNDHFQYRLAPADGPYIDSHRGHRAFGFSDDGAVFLSEDCGATWSQRVPFPNARNITFSCFLKNGNLLFATRTKLYRAVAEDLKSYEEVRVKNLDGDDYVPHTPKNPDNPGWYFHSLDGVHTWDIDGREILVWGNYCNVRGGAVPVAIYYSTDGGETVKIAYAFGRNPFFNDDGSAGGGRGKEGGTILGNPDNTVICRHIHAVCYNPAENAFYACTGDIDRGHGHECHWLRGTYDLAADAWGWQVKVSVNSNSRYKSGGINFVDGQLYWAADANGPKKLNQTYDRGIFRCDPADLGNPDKHTRLYDLSYESANMIIEDDFMIASHCAPASPWNCDFAVSHDLGKTWAQCDLKEFGKRSPVRFHPKNAEGWFRVDLRTGWIDRSEVLFIKPKA